MNNFNEVRLKQGMARAVASHAFGNRKSEARAVANYLGHRVLGLRRTANHARIEARRSDPVFDRVIVNLETLLRVSAGGAA